MHPPQSSCVTSLPHSLMERLLMTGNGSNDSTSMGDLKESSIKDIAVKLRQYENVLQLSNGNGNGNTSNSSSTSPLNAKRPDCVRLDNKAPAMALVCVDCGIMKNSAEEMENHLKMEHLNWLPFRCPVCYVERASDVLMREHLHAAHKEKMHNYIYTDNMEAKRLLMQMMDHSFANAVLIKNSDSLYRGYMSSSNGDSRNETSSRLTLEYADSSPSTSSPGISATVTAQQPSSLDNGTHINDLLESICKAARGGGFVEGEVMDQENCNENIFVAPKHEIDEDGDGMDGLGDCSVLDSLNPISVLDNVAALFNTETCKEEPSANDKSGKNGKASNVSGTKKRVLGECSKCNKPVTAGARQMHMFFHLAKDQGIFRFRCLFDGCKTEHYRKDQMENHQVKSHGKIVPEKMEDRSLELFSRCQALNHELFVANRSLISHQQSSQDLSMELIGTKNGSTPGPTAAKAEIAYNNQLAAKEKEKQNKLANSSLKSDVASVAAPVDDDRILKCQKCGKTMQNRLRGFHVLWHLAKDKNINRYVCVICNFAHDRAQSVQTHGKKEHREYDGDVCRDRIGEYDEEVKQMSFECFGFESSFATPDNKRRSKIPASGAGSKNRKRPRIEEDIPAAVEDDSHLGHSPDTADEAEQSEPVIKHCVKATHSSSKCTDPTVLRQISALVEGAQFYDKRKAKGATCVVCKKEPDSRLTEHVYTHMKESLFVCPVCDFGSNCRVTVKKHITDSHETVERPIDHRLKYAGKIKDNVQICFPSIFIDAPVPTSQDISLLKGPPVSPIDEEEDGRDTPRSFSSLTSMYSLYSEMSSETDGDHVEGDEL